MSEKQANTGGKGRLAIVILVVIVIVPFAYSTVAHVLAQGQPETEPFLAPVDPQHENCVKDSTWMRYHHWELLRGIREEVVRYGKRGEVSLNTCQECHTSREQFCNRCHDATSLTPDCFGCHYYP